MAPKRQPVAKKAKLVGDVDVYGSNLMTTEAVNRGRDFLKSKVLAPRPFVEEVWEDFGISELLDFMKVKEFFSYGASDYNVKCSPLMVKEFYANLTSVPNQPHMAISYISRKKITISIDILVRLFHFDGDHSNEFRSWRGIISHEPSNEFMRRQILRRRETVDRVSQLSTAHFFPKWRLIASLFIEFLSKKGGHKSSVELDTLDFCVSMGINRKLCIPAFIISNMIKVKPGDGNLPYGFLISRLASHYGVNVDLYMDGYRRRNFDLGIKRKMCLLTLDEERRVNVEFGDFTWEQDKRENKERLIRLFKDLKRRFGERVIDDDDEEDDEHGGDGGDDDGGDGGDDGGDGGDEDEDAEDMDYDPRADMGGSSSQGGFDLSQVYQRFDRLDLRYDEVSQVQHEVLAENRFLRDRQDQLISRQDYVIGRVDELYQFQLQLQQGQTDIRQGQIDMRQDMHDRFDQLFGYIQGQGGPFYGGSGPSTGGAGTSSGGGPSAPPHYYDPSFPPY